MHDIGFDHLHPSPEEREHLSEVIWAADNVELTTVGVDVGSSTSHLMFARVHLQRLATGLSSQFVVVNREVLWRSPITLTPYRPDGLIDADQLDAFVHDSYDKAGFQRGDIDSGAVILTGEALKRANARSIADLFAEESGKFVCASAGHHMESAMAAHGSGAVALSRRNKNTILNVDIGGGTTKFSLIREGELLATAAVAVGGRLLVVDGGGMMTRVEEPILSLAKNLSLNLELGGRLDKEDRRRLIKEMTDIVITLARQEPMTDMVLGLMVTDPLPSTPKPDAVTFSGGVSEYLYGRETDSYDDLGSDLAHRIGHALADGELDIPVWDPGQGIRATVIGASQFSVQISGNTIMVSDPSLLPLRNIPVLICRFDLEGGVDEHAATEEVKAALTRHDIDLGERTVALTFSWVGDPLHSRLHALAKGMHAALAAKNNSGPLIMLVDGDVGMTLGRIIRDEIDAECTVISIDGLQLKDFDYVDIGEIIHPTNVVPIIIKSLLF